MDTQNLIIKDAWKNACFQENIQGPENKVTIISIFCRYITGICMLNRCPKIIQKIHYNVQKGGKLLLLLLLCVCLCSSENQQLHYMHLVPLFLALDTVKSYVPSILKQFCLEYLNSLLPSHAEIYLFKCLTTFLNLLLQNLS